MGGAIPPFPQYAFMASCSVKAQGQLYFHLYYMRLCSLSLISWKLYLISKLIWPQNDLNLANGQFVVMIEYVREHVARVAEIFGRGN
jgi:hypothetical protein